MRRFKFVSVLVVLALMLSFLPHQAQPVLAAPPAVFINEIHYDNLSTDVGEAVEIAGPAGTDITGWSLVLYNGNGGITYGTPYLFNGLIPDLGGGFGVVTTLTPGMQNGSPDGLALVDASNNVIQFLSYEGVFAATNGPAAGLMSLDIGVEEAGNEATGQSLQLAGTGNLYRDFTWQADAAETFGAFNHGQTFASSSLSGVGLAAPAAVRPGTLTLLTVAVTPASPPVSTGIAVSADLSSIGGSSSQDFYDDGTHGDAAADDYTFSYQATVSAGTPVASRLLPVEISDDQAHSAATSIALDVIPPITSLALQQTSDQVTWSPVDGNLKTGFRMNLDNAVPFYYLDVASLASTAPLKADSYQPFTLDTASVPADFYSYWAAKGVFSGATGTWEPLMWQIINGDLPMFYLKVSSTTPAFMLVDGLKHALGQPDELLAVNGDYPRGDYRFVGQITDDSDQTSPVTVDMSFFTANEISTLTLQQAVDPAGLWAPVGGTLADGYHIALDASREFYYLDIASLEISTALQEDYHPFTLDVTSVPAGFYDYWAAKGVTATAAGGWEPTMWQIINGELPMFFLKVTAGEPPAYMLVDGLQHALAPSVDTNLRVSGDYPAGTYRFFGDLTSEGGSVSSLDVDITFSANQAVQVTSADPIATYETVAASGPLAALDPDGTLVSAAITGGGATGISLTNIVQAASVGGELTATLALDNTVAAGTYNVEITFTNDDTFPQSATATVQVTVYPATCPAPDPTYPLQASIGAVQGSGLTPAVTGKVTVTGIITNRSLNGGAGTQYGFYIQDTGDGDPQTSDGLFVYTSSGNQLGKSLPVGSPVMVSGTVSDYNNGTQITPVYGTGVMACGVATTIPPVTVNLPQDSDPVLLLERYENMLVHLPQTFTIDQNYFQGRYGQITVSPGGRLYTPTNGNLSGTVDELTADLQSRMIVLDDNNYIQNPSPTPYLSLGTYPYNTDIFDPVRAGDLIEGGNDPTQGLTGILDQGATNSSAGPYSPWYRLQPTVWPTITRGNNPRTTAPVDPGGDVKVAGFNLYNYFTTLDMAPFNSTAPYDGGSNTPRGADSTLEFTRQKTKTVLSIIGLDADITGVIELENNGEVAIDDLVNGTGGLNEVAGAGTYAFVADSLPLPDLSLGADSPDYIKAGIIYKPAVVTPVGASVWSDNAIFDRPPLAQTFQVNATGEEFTVVVNHFKSKGSCPTSGDVDQGQGCWNLKRVEQANALLTFINDTLIPVDPDVIAVGDYNAYGNEDPINALTAGGLVNELLRVPAEDRYTYVFDGAAGYLDQMLVTSGIDAAVNGVSIWHINADESALIDYNTEYKAPISNYPPDPYDGNVPYRSSDHDPVLLGFTTVNQAPSADAGGPYSTLQGIPVQVSATGVDPEGTTVTFAWDLDNNGSFETAGQSVTFDNVLTPGVYTIKLQATDAFGAARVVETTVQVLYAYRFPVIMNNGTMTPDR